MKPFADSSTEITRRRRPQAAQEHRSLHPFAYVALWPHFFFSSSQPTISLTPSLCEQVQLQGLCRFHISEFLPSQKSTILAPINMWLPSANHSSFKASSSSSIYSHTRTMVAGFFTREIAGQASADRIWKAGVLDSHNLLPKLLPEFITSGELVEGNGGVGTIKILTFSEAKHEFSFVKDRVEVLDRENYKVKQIVIEGGIVGLRVKTYSYELKLDAGSNGETIGKIRVEYDTLDDTPLNAEEEQQISGGLLAMFKVIDGYLIENPTSYA